jgi:hypothetical protein
LQIDRTEVSEPLQFAPSQDDQLAVAQVHGPTPPEVGERPVHRHDRHAQRLAELRQADRQTAAIAADELRGAGAVEQRRTRTSPAFTLRIRSLIPPHSILAVPRAGAERRDMAEAEEQSVNFVDWARRFAYLRAASLPLERTRRAAAEQGLAFCP